MSTPKYMHRIMSPLDDCPDHPGGRLFNLLRFALFQSGARPEGLPLVPMRDGRRAACRCMTAEEGDGLREAVEEAFNSGRRKLEDFPGEILVDPAHPEEF